MLNTHITISIMLLVVLFAFFLLLYLVSFLLHTVVLISAIRDLMVIHY